MGRKVNWGIIAADGIARRMNTSGNERCPECSDTGIMDEKSESFG